MYSHPLWGDSVLVPAHVEGLPQERLKELDPFTDPDRRRDGSAPQEADCTKQGTTSKLNVRGLTSAY